METLFLLLRLGADLIEDRGYNSDVFCALEKDDWIQLRLMADKQGVSAIVFDGLDRLIKTVGRECIVSKTIGQDWWSLYVRDWMGMVIRVEQANRQQRVVMDDMASHWISEGCRVMVMKGQASAMMYPKPEHRTPGDIDCYLFENYARGNDIAKSIGAVVDESWYKHSQIRYKGEMFENHQFFVHTREGKRSKQLEGELENALKMNDSCLIPLTSNVSHPPAQWTAMFLTYHACAHFLSEGLRLKQLYDWVMFLKKHQKDVDWFAFYEFCEYHHLRRFADAVTAISVEYFGVNITDSIIAYKSPYAERILHSILYDDDYVFASGKGSWYNRWHLVKNLWTYRWKYRDIYQMSPLCQLWYYVSGYLFKTE